MRWIAVSLIAVAATAGPASAQQPMGQQRQPRYVYEAYYQISFADMEEWNRIYREYAAPIWNTLRDEGLIQGWSASTHQTGEAYNWRLALRFYDWASKEPAVQQYVSRLEKAAPPATVEKMRRMIVAHHDELWQVGDVRLPPEGAPPTRYAYHSSFQINFGDLPEWNRIYEQTIAPILADAMRKSLLGGWVTYNHDTGGEYNWKIIYLFRNWDSIDDFFGEFLGRLQKEHPEPWTRIGRLAQAHKDYIWAPVPMEATSP